MQQPTEEKRKGLERALEYMGLEGGQAIESINVDRVFIGSCTNSRIEDMRAAAAVAKGRQVASSVKQVLIVPGSQMVKAQAEAEGLDKIFIAAGMDWREPGCSMCLAMNADKLGAGEHCASTSNRNFEGSSGQWWPYPFDESCDGGCGGGGGSYCRCTKLFITRCRRSSLMKAFTAHRGLVGPMDRANVDTDMIIPKQFLKSIKRSGFGPNLFDELRYEDEGQPGADCSNRPLKEDFPLNFPRYKGASILLARKNFGCGSSREHAPWAIEDYGFNAVIAPSYADIFYNNCFKNGLLPVILTEEQVDILFKEMEAEEGYQLSIDLPSQTVTTDSGHVFSFELDEFRKECLLNGLDEIGLTLKEADAIKQYETERAAQHPWVFGAIK